MFFLLKSCPVNDLSILYFWDWRSSLSCTCMPQWFLFLDNLNEILRCTFIAGPQCGGQYTSSEGVVISPGFPSPYTHESECVWTITVPAGDTITLTFTTIDIEFESTCNYDFVEVIKRFLILHNCCDSIRLDLQDGRFAKKGIVI